MHRLLLLASNAADFQDDKEEVKCGRIDRIGFFYAVGWTVATMEKEIEIKKTHHVIIQNGIKAIERQENEIAKKCQCAMFNIISRCHQQRGERQSVLRGSV